MRHYLFYLVLSGVLLASCKKDSDSSPRALVGDWRMVLVTDRTSGVSETKPTTITKDVTISFELSGITEGSFSGRTPSNQFSGDFSTTMDRDLSIDRILITDVNETSWGNLFRNNLDTRNYSFDSQGQLVITCVSKILTFQKM
jgi:hypothetical protein